MSRTRDKVEKLLLTIDELQSSDSTNQLSARRAERELREEREKALRLERELETWKNRGGIQGTVRRSGQWKRAGTPALEDNGNIEVPTRRSSLLQREISLSKGFL